MKSNGVVNENALAVRKWIINFSESAKIYGRDVIDSMLFMITTHGMFYLHKSLCISFITYKLSELME